MEITLREITKDNYEAVCELEVADEQKGHLSPNIQSILEAKFHESLIPRAIYCGDEPVGFIMSEQSSKKQVGIFRFMIDEIFQKRGIGRAALELAISEISQIEGVSEVQICYHPDNTIARKLYLDIGFEEIGIDESGTDMLAVRAV